MGEGNSYLIVLLIFSLVVFLVIVIMALSYLKLWVAANFAGVPVNLISLIMMRLRRVTPAHIVLPMITAHKAGIHLTSDQLESHYLAGGKVHDVVCALISADKARIPLSWERATAIDLAGRNVLEAVQMSVKPKVIDCPDPTAGSKMVAAVAKDGIQLLARARVTVRANLDRLVGGATEETIVARVGEGIVTTIGSAESHKEILQHPDNISKTVLSKGLDAGTGFEILSIDIADVDVGENIGAKLQIAQANADKQIAQAKAEERKAMALAREQEMKAQVQEMRARVVEAEAQIPMAMAEALKKGHMGFMDYFRLQNIKADTQMRQSISQPQEETPSNTT